MIQHKIWMKIWKTKIVQEWQNELASTLYFINLQGYQEICLNILNLE